MQSQDKLNAYTASLNKQLLTVEIRDGYGNWIYEIDIEKCRTAAEALDWVFQVFNKPWATPELLFEILGALETACQNQFSKPAQGVWCPFGQSQKVKWPFRGSYVDGT